MSNAQNLSPAMTTMLTWIAKQDQPVRISNERTVNALIKRGLIEEAATKVNYGRPVQATAAGRAAVGI